MGSGKERVDEGMSGRGREEWYKLFQDDPAFRICSCAIQYLRPANCAAR